MSPELDKQLCEKYPLIFAQRHRSMQETAMCWGFDVGDGWYNILDALCANIQNHINNINRQIEYKEKMNSIYDGVRTGDLTLFNDYYKSFKSEYRSDLLKKIYSGEIVNYHIPEKEPQTEAVQVKEKFGTLRFYIDYGDDSVYAFIAMAESMSARTCETCGKPGKLRGTGWVYTSCNDHAKDGDKDEDGHG